MQRTLEKGRPVASGDHDGNLGRGHARPEPARQNGRAARRNLRRLRAELVDDLLRLADRVVGAAVVGVDLSRIRQIEAGNSRAIRRHALAVVRKHHGLASSSRNIQLCLIQERSNCGFTFRRPGS